MKKTLIAMLVLVALGGAVFAAGQFSLTPRVGYGITDYAFEINVDASTTQKMAYVSKGVDIGLDFGYQVNPNLTIYADGDFILPFHAAHYLFDDGRMTGTSYNKKELTDSNGLNYQDLSWFGWKFNVGVMYNLPQLDRFKLGVGGGLGLTGTKQNYKESGDTKKYENSLFGVALALKAKADYTFNEKVALSVVYEPNLVLYSKYTTKYDGNDRTYDGTNNVAKDGAVSFRIAPTLAVGVTFTF